MKVREAILMLQDLKPDDEICISWWCKDLFETPDEPMPIDDWLCAVESFDSENGYEHVNQIVHGLINDAIADYRYRTRNKFFRSLWSVDKSDYNEGY